MGLFGDSLRFALGIKPRWTSELPPHLLPDREQIGRLEMLRAEVGLSHEEFFHHIAGHPESTRRAQRRLFNEIRRQNPRTEEHELLKLLVVSRWKTAVTHGGDLFGLSSVRDEEEFTERLDNIVEVNRDLESIIEAMIQDEERASPGLPPAPMFEKAARQVTEILRDDGQRKERRVMRSDVVTGGRSENHSVTIEQMGAVLATGAALDAFFGEEPLLRLVLESDSSLKDTMPLRIEVISFCLLPFERVATARFPSHAAEIRSSTVSAAESGVRGMFLSGREPPVGEIAATIERRLNGYGMTLGPTPTRSDWQRLSYEASGVIKGDVVPDPKLAGVLGFRFASAMKHYPTTLEEYQVVSG